MNLTFVLSARIRLHRARAFMDIPMFSRKYCGLTAIENERDEYSAIGSLPSPDIDLAFPFTEEKSSLICLKSALAISRALKSLSMDGLHPSHPRTEKQQQITTDNPPPFLLPFFVCSAMQGSYALLMSLHRLRGALVSDDLSSCYHLLNNPEKSSEIQDAQRLMREIQDGLKSVLDAMKGAQMFEGVASMSKEIRIAYQSAFMSC